MTHNPHPSDSSVETPGSATPETVAAVFLHRPDERSPGQLCWTEEGGAQRYPDGTRFYAHSRPHVPAGTIERVVETARTLASVVPSEFLERDEALREWHRLLCADLDALDKAHSAPPQNCESGRPTDEACIAVYDAVSRSNLTRDVKTPARKVAVVTQALAKFGGAK